LDEQIEQSRDRRQGAAFQSARELRAMAMVGESKQQMASRHVAEQERRIAKQKALIRRLSNHKLPTQQAKYLLAEMIGMLDNMQSELRQLSEPSRKK